MKQFLILFLLMQSTSSFAQLDRLKVGDIWPYKNPYIRTIPDSVELHEFNYYEGLAKVTYNKKIGFVDSNKIIVIPLIYEYGLGANRFIKSRSIVVKNDYWGVIDISGNQVIPFKYGRIRNRDSLYCVYAYESNKWGFLDLFGNTVLPINDYRRSSIMTKEEILELAKDYYKKDSLEKSTTISKKKAILIAKRKKYYWEGEFPFAASVELDTSSNQWIIKSSKYEGVTYDGRCAKTNGCVIVKYAIIVISADKGRIVEKSKYQTKTPNYE